MEIQLTRDQEDFIRRAVENGRFPRPEDAVREALALWEERERRRGEILAAVDSAEDRLARGEGAAVTDPSIRQLADDVKQRGRARLAAGKFPLRTADFFAGRKGKSNRKAFRRLMTREGGEPPQPGDEMPTD